MADDGRSILTIDPAAIAANWRVLADRAAPGACAAVLKADAYGCGAAAIAPALWAAGCRDFFVAHLDEGVVLRALLPAARIAVLNGLAPGTLAEFEAHDLTPVLNDLGQIALWRGRPQAAMVHLDTGMNRLGLGPDEQERLAADPPRDLAVSHWLTHLACADEPEHPMNAAQAARFRAILARLPPAATSLANSAGLHLGPGFASDLARPGVALYGGWAAPGLRPVLRLQARVLQVRHVDRGMTVGYGAAHSVAQPGKVATIAMGYADGYLRAAGAPGRLCRIGGAPVPVIGRVSMDLVTLDVTGHEVVPGDLVDVLDGQWTVHDLAAAVGTIAYEILTGLGRRYRRRYEAWA